MKLCNHLKEEGETTANVGATTTSDIAKYEPKLSFLVRRKKKRKIKESNIINKIDRYLNEIC